MFASLGKVVTDAEIDGMIREAPGDINFTMFLTLFGEKLTGTDPEDVIKNAFMSLDEDGSGQISEERLRELLMTIGDRYSDEEVDELFKEAPIKNGLFDYQEFVKIPQIRPKGSRLDSRQINVERTLAFLSSSA